MAEIWKYDFEIIDDVQPKDIPIGARVALVDVQLDHPCVWMVVEPERGSEIRVFRVIGAGHKFSAEKYVHIGSVQIHPFVWHIVESVSRVTR